MYKCVHANGDIVITGFPFPFLSVLLIIYIYMKKSKWFSCSDRHWGRELVYVIDCVSEQNRGRTTQAVCFFLLHFRHETWNITYVTYHYYLIFFLVTFVRSFRLFQFMKKVHLFGFSVHSGGIVTRGESLLHKWSFCQLSIPLKGYERVCGIKTRRRRKPQQCLET